MIRLPRTERSRRWTLVWGLLAVGFACRPATSTQPGAAPSAAASAPAAAEPGVAGRVRALASAEQRRASREVTPADLTSHDVLVRRAAARALARIADARAAELLLPTLGDEDPEVVTWSAYGLGVTCQDHEALHSRALAARGTSLLVRRALAKARDVSPGPLLDPLSSVAAALGRCGGGDAERTLRAWLALGPPLAEAAAWALGGDAGRRDRLEDATLVALLDAASRATSPVAAALQAFTRLSHVDDPVAARLYDVAHPLLGDATLRGALAVRALALGGSRAAADLGAVVTGTPPAARRADAARALGRLAASGQAALADALLRLVPDGASLDQAKLLGPDFGVLTAVLTTLAPPPERAGPALSRLVALPIGQTPALLRRTVTLRCMAASLLAGRGSESPLLAGCDPDPKGQSGELARLAVLDRGKLAGARLRQWTALASADQALVRERALELVGRHDEVAASGPLARALASKTGGEVATAAHLLAEHPGRASLGGGPDAPAPEVTRALVAALERWTASPSIEVRTNLIDAAAALGLLAAKPRLETACASDNPTLRTHAEKGLRLLGDRDRHCATFTPPSQPPVELARALTKPAHVELETDAGTLALDLDPQLAPVAVTRLVELARAHFFDGVVIHRVVPGFVVQLGDPDGDGYGGSDRPPLRCETSPVPFDGGSVGIALSGRDTGSSQFFVTLGREAHLDGDYAWIGRAGPGWDRVAEGDVVKAVRVR